MMATRLARADLVAHGMRELGRGGEGIVYKSPLLGSEVYKEFLSTCATTPDAAALEQLIVIADQTWTERDRDWLVSRTTWPRRMVMDGPHLRGYVMPEIPLGFFRRYGIRASPRVVPCEWNYLSLRAATLNPNIVSDIPVPSPKEIWDLLSDLAGTIAVLHSYDVVVGDISGRNLLWTIAPRPTVLVIDCDSFRLAGHGGVGTPKQSPDWEDPESVGPTTQSSDVYKLGLAAFRAMAGAGTDRPTASLTASSIELFTHSQGAAATLAELIRASVGPTSDRPTAAEWRQRLLLGGRRMVPVAPPQPAPPIGAEAPEARKWVALTPRQEPTVVEAWGPPDPGSRRWRRVGEST
jgi:hypothetical protein